MLNLFVSVFEYVEQRIHTRLQVNIHSVKFQLYFLLFHTHTLIFSGTLWFIYLSNKKLADFGKQIQQCSWNPVYQIKIYILYIVLPRKRKKRSWEINIAGLQNHMTPYHEHRLSSQIIYLSSSFLHSSSILSPLVFAVLWNLIPDLERSCYHLRFFCQYCYLSSLYVHIFTTAKSKEENLLNKFSTRTVDLLRLYSATIKSCAIFSTVLDLKLLIRLFKL